jgi:hypothetical protein
MGRTRVALLFNEENEKQREVCEYLKSQPRCKTALVTELVYEWLKSKDNNEPVFNVAGSALQNIEALKVEITAELLQNRDFIEKITECIDSRKLESPTDSGVEAVVEDATGDMDFDEDMLLNGMAMFEI